MNLYPVLSFENYLTLGGKCLTAKAQFSHLLNEHDLQYSEIWQEPNETMYKKFLANWEAHCLLGSPHPEAVFRILSLYWKLRASPKGLSHNVLHCSPAHDTVAALSDAIPKV